MGQIPPPLRAWECNMFFCPAGTYIDLESAILFVTVDSLSKQP
jgi:hypothetical protein